MLITTAEINTLAFLTPIDVSYFKTNIMYAAQERYLRNILSDTLIDSVIADPTSFPILLENYIKPYLAYQIKSLTFSLLESELAIDEAFTNISQAIIQSALKAKDNKSSLQDYIYSTYGILPSSINGFTIPQTIITANENSVTMPTTDVNDIAPATFTASIGQSSFPLPNTLKRSSLVFVNDSFVVPVKYTGIGTTTITFLTALNQYDKVIITF